MVRKGIDKESKYDARTSEQWWCDELCYESLSGNRDEAEIISCDEIGEARVKSGKGDARMKQG